MHVYCSVHVFHSCTVQDPDLGNGATGTGLGLPGNLIYIIPHQDSLPSSQVVLQHVKLTGKGNHHIMIICAFLIKWFCLLCVISNAFLKPPRNWNTNSIVLISQMEKFEEQQNLANMLKAEMTVDAETVA